MSKAEIKVETKAAHYEIRVDGVRVNGETKDLAPGSHTVRWDFEGDPGTTIEITVTVDGVVVIHVKDTIPPGRTVSGSLAFFKT